MRCRFFTLIVVCAAYSACSRDHADVRAPSPVASTPSPLQPPAPASAPAPRSVPSEAAAQTANQPPSPAAEPATIAAWTDPPIVEELVRDCKFKPPQAAPNEPEPSALSCTSGLYEQSCAVDPCYATDQTQCKPRCEKACNSCDDRCTAGCTQCKTRCNDDACRRTCATTCATCKQACLGEKDRCASGTCAAEYKTCTEQLVKRWKQSGCARACDAHQECAAKCQNASSCAAGGNEKACEQCTSRCTATVRRNCAADLVEICLFNGAGPSDAP